MVEEFEDYENDTNESKGQTIPLYQEVKNLLLSRFTTLADMNAQVQICNGFEYSDALNIFKGYYISLYPHIDDDEKLGKLSGDEQKYMKYYYMNNHLIKDVSANKIVALIRKMMNKMRIYDLTVINASEDW